MVSENIDEIVNKYHGFLTENQESELKEQLSAAADEKAEAALSVKTKKPCVTVILSSILGLFGAGSFYVGRVKRGIIKLIFNVIVPLALGMVFLFWLAPLNKTYSEQSEKVYLGITGNVLPPQPQPVIEVPLNSLNEVQGEFSSAYGDYNSYVTDISSRKESLNNFYAYLNNKEESDSVSGFSKEFTAFISVLDSLENSAELSSLATETQKAFSAKLLLSENQEEENIYSDKIEEFISSVQSIKSFSISSASTSIENTIDKIDGIINAQCFEDIFSALNSMSGYITTLSEISEELEGLSDHLNNVSESGAGSLTTLLTSLNNQVFYAQEQAGLNTAESAEKTSLGLAITQFENYFERISNTDLNESETAEEEYTVNSFNADFKAENDLAVSALKALNSVNDISGAVANATKMQTKAREFGNSFSNYYTQLKDNLLEQTSVKVDITLSLTDTMNYICDTINDTVTQTDINVINTEMDGVCKKLSALAGSSMSDTGSAYAQYYSWKETSEFLNLFFGLTLGADAIIIVSYWISEVFKDRKKCYDLNYTNLQNSIK